MSHSVAISLALVILAFVGADVIFNDGAALIFLGRKMLVLINWIAVWR